MALSSLLCVGRSSGIGTNHVEVHHFGPLIYTPGLDVDRPLAYGVEFLRLERGPVDCVWSLERGPVDCVVIVIGARIRAL
jgi:hypothetical protein